MSEDEAIVICVAVIDCPTPVPGSVIIECSGCGQPLWRSPTAPLERPVCIGCVPGGVDVEVRVTPTQRAEFHRRGWTDAEIAAYAAAAEIAIESR